MGKSEQDSNMKKHVFQGCLFLFLIVLVESVFRISGSKSGVLINEIYPVDSLIYQPRFKADSVGMDSFVKDSPYLPEGYVINNQGFRSEFDFDVSTVDSIRSVNKKKVVFLIGDSYTEGCCPTSMDSSFSDLLIQDDEYVVLNFGVGGTGVKQYNLVAEHYVKELQPDLVVVNFYLANDMIHYDVPVIPNVPHTYPFKNFKWLASVGPAYYMTQLEKNHLASPEEAYEFYLSNFTLWHNHANWPEKLIRHSVILSKLYLGVREKYHMFNWAKDNYKKGQDVIFTNQVLLQIKETCQLHQTDLLMVSIPGPSDVEKQKNLETLYAKYFVGTEYAFPDVASFRIEDYDGMATSNHFNNSGHRKYHQFLKREIDDRLKN